MAELGALEAMAELGAQAAMAELGAQAAMADRLRGLGLGPLGPAPTAGNPFYPPKKIPWGSQGVSGALRGWTDRTVQENPPGPDRQDKTVHDRTGKPSGARQTGHDSPQKPEALLGELGS